MGVCHVMDTDMRFHTHTHTNTHTHTCTSTDYAYIESEIVNPVGLSRHYEEKVKVQKIE